MSANGKGLSSPRGKKYVNIAYCVGAALVIVGALMKLMHWPGWDTFLPIGMGAEAILFLLGAFDEPHHEGSKWDWSSVYPNLTKELSPAEILELQKNKKKSDIQEASKAVKEAKKKGADEPANIPEPVVAAPVAGNMGVASGLSEEDMKKWNESVSKISETADNISKLSDVGNVSDSYLKKLDAAGNAVESLAKAQEESATAISSSTENLASNYKQTAEALAAHKDAFAQSGDDTKQGIESVSKNLTAINSVYELQLNLVNEELKAKEAQNQAQISINDQLALIQQAVMASVTANQKYQEESKKLETNISELNSVYGNMLSSLK